MHTQMSTYEHARVGITSEMIAFISAQVAPLTPAARAGFDAAARFWSRSLRPQLEAAAERTRTPPGPLMRSFWA